MGPPRLYTREYFQLFAALILHMTGVSLQFHFGKFVADLGGSPGALGWIMGIGMAGALVARPRIGGWVDHFGTRPVLLGGSITAGVVALSYRLTDHLTIIAALRIIATLANAVVFTAVAAHSALIAPPRRRAESLGTIGMGGFTGMILGPTLGDWIFTHPVAGFSPFTVFFVCAALAHWIAAGLVAPLRSPRPTPDPDLSRASFFRTLRAYWPGMILLVGVTFTLGQTIPFVWLERFADARGIAHIRNFYFGYALTAIILRVIGRRVPERVGRRRTLLAGLLMMASGLLLLTTVHRAAGLFAPAIVMGAGHCFIFPSLIDLAAERFPPARRGMGTSVILGAGDLGFLAGFAGWGQLIERVGFAPTFGIVCGWTLLVAGAYAWRERRVVFRGAADGP